MYCVLNSKMDIKTLEPKLQELIEAARNMKQFAHCPYSNFHVGAAVLCPDGSIYAGCNVENASYGLSVCAERNAVMKAVSEGHKKFVAAAVSCEIQETFEGPCGVCRQVFAEFGMDIDLYIVKPDMTYMKVTVAEMLPMAFTPAFLDAKQT